MVLISKLGNISLDELLTGEYKENQTGAAAHIIKDTESPYEPSSADQKLNIEEAIGKAYIILNAGTALSVALYLNIQQFSAAMDAAKELKVCQDQIKDMQKQMDSLNRKVDSLTAVPTSADSPAAGSEEKAT